MLRRNSAIGVLIVCAVASFAAGAVPGYTLDFNDGTVDPFFSGADLTWQASGGVGGAGDGWLSSVRASAGNLGLATVDSNITGNLTADGVTGYSFWLKDLGSQAPLNIHVSIGDPFINFWQSNIAFIPVTTGWTQYSIDFTNPAQWTQIQGTGTFADALTTSGRLLFRHDLAPYTSNPNTIRGGLGLDRLTVLPEPATLLLIGAGALLAARRR